MEDDNFENEAERDDMDDDDGEEIPRVPRNGTSGGKHGGGGGKKASAAQKESERKKRELINMGKAKGFLTYDIEGRLPRAADARTNPTSIL